jgi:peptidyl-prolyl cis-trans isomerase SurA
VKQNRNNAFPSSVYQGMDSWREKNVHRSIPVCLGTDSWREKSGRWSVAFGILLALLLVGQPASAEILDRVVATINDRAIMQSELQEALELYLQQVGQQPPEMLSERDRTALQRRVLEDLVDKSLIEDFAVKAGIEASDEEINRAIDEVLARAHISEKELREALAQDNLDYEEYRSQIRDQLIKAKMIQREIRSRINITDKQIEEYYLDHPDEFRAEEGVVLRHILFPLPYPPAPEVVDATVKEASRVRQEILDGKSFSEAARQYSKDSTAGQGGWLGFFRKGSLSPEMEAGIVVLKEGEVSEPVQTGLGIHLLEVEERTTGDIRPLEKVKSNIQEKLYEEAAERQFEEWRKELRKNAHIEDFL